MSLSYHKDGKAYLGVRHNPAAHLKNFSSIAISYFIYYTPYLLLALYLSIAAAVSNVNKATI